MEMPKSDRFRSSFESQKRKRFYSKIGCGIAVTIMLLKYHKIDPLPSFKDLGDLLRVNEDVIKKWPKVYSVSFGGGAYIEDIEEYLNKIKIKYISIKSKSDVNRKRLFAMLKDQPVIVGVSNNWKRWGDYGHWICLVQKKGKVISYLDPQYGKSEKFLRKISTLEFQHEWDGAALAIVDKLKNNI